MISCLRQACLAGLAFLAVGGPVAAAEGEGAGLPEGFVYLRAVDPTIRQEVRYFGHHNFMGRPVPGYGANEIVLTREAAEALAAVQAELTASGYTLKVYDGYRPQRAVDAFAAWAEDPHDDAMRAEFYPEIPKDELFPRGYIAARSGHSRGSTVDLTIVALPVREQATYRVGERLVPCTAPYGVRFDDNSIDMGTGFDCMSEMSHHGNREIPLVAQRHREIRSGVMQKHGFVLYEQEWWHYTLADEPYPDTYFDFPIVPMDE